MDYSDDDDYNYDSDEIMDGTQDDGACPAAAAAR